MAFGDIFKVDQFKNELQQMKAENQKLLADNQRLHEDNYNLSKMLTPEMRQVEKITARIKELDSYKNSVMNQIARLDDEIENRNLKLHQLEMDIASKKIDVVELDDKILLQDFGIYTPIYNLVNSEAYKDRLAVIRQKQKDIIKNDRACTYPTTFTLDGSLDKGKKMIKDNVKQILRSFNNECDAVIDKVKFNNIESIRKKIEKSYNDLNKMNSSLQLCIVPQYLLLKLEELNLCYEYSVKKQQEKEEQKQIREQLREEAKLQKELEEARKTIDKEKNHYENVLKQLRVQLSAASDSEKNELEAREADILSHLCEIKKSIEDIDYREANKRAGYVYIISNIGSFGEDVYKIGMTRRLEPTDRVDELGDASVPFNFDIHAMIFSDDAPALENTLHKAFEARKVNMVNQRREFFSVTLDDIEEIVKQNYDKTVEFKRTAAAEQYRESLILKKALQ